MFDFAPLAPFANVGPILTHGLVAGTKVVTRDGRRAVDGLIPGDECLTFDGGFQQVVHVGRDILDPDAIQADPANWPLMVPAGALGNRIDTVLLPDQAVLVESDTAEAVLGDPFALVPALALDGLRGIRRARPRTALKVITLHFAGEEVVYADAGALLHCPARGDLLAQTAAPVYAPLTLEKAELLVRHIDLEDRGRADPAQALRDFRTAA